MFTPNEVMVCIRIFICLLGISALSSSRPVRYTSIYTGIFRYRNTGIEKIFIPVFRIPVYPVYRYFQVYRCFPVYRYFSVYRQKGAVK